MTLALLIGGWLLLLAGASEACRRAPPKLMVALWFIVPLALLPMWLETSREGEWPLFLWVKTYSVTLGITWLSVCRSWPDRLPVRAIQWPMYLILAVNILEAVAQDFLSGTAYNAIAGLLLVATLGWPSRIEVDSGGVRDLHFRLGVPWILAFTIWNAALLYGNWEGLVFGQHVAVLGAAMMIGIVTGWQKWFQARAFTIGVQMLAYCTFYFPLREAFDTSHLYTDGRRDMLHMASLALVTSLLAFQVIRSRRNSSGEA